MKEKEIIKLLKELIKRKGVNPAYGGEGELEKGVYVKEFIERLGFKVKDYRCKDKEGNERINLVTEVKGKSKKYIYFLAHLDVVPPGNLEEWKSDPFDLKVVKEKGRVKVIGRGVNDNGIGIVSTLILLNKVSSLLPNYSLKFFFLSDEEAGSDYGLKWLIKNSNEVKKGNYAIVPDAGNDKGTFFEIAEKGILWLKINVIGKQSHGSMPQEGKNSFYFASKLVILLKDSLYKKYKAKNKLFLPNISTFEPTRVEENVKAPNIIPGKTTFYMDNRVLPAYNLNEVLKFIKSIVKKFEKENKVKVKISVLQKEGASFTSENSFIVKKSIEAIRKVLKIKVKPMGIGGGTYAGILRKKGIESVVWSKCSESEHQVNEYEYVDNYLATAKVFEKIII